jgi:membrane protein YqaA with SNARE-associated domain
MRFREFMSDLGGKLSALFFFLIAGMALWVLAQLLYLFYGFSIMQWIKSLPYLYPSLAHIATQIQAQTDIGIFYLFAVASLVLLPVPLEILFFKLMSDGIPLQKLFFLTLGGILAGQLINYTLGRGLGVIFMQFFKKKTKEKIQQRLDRYGTLAVFLMHIIPAPFQPFNFIAGALKYKFFRWFFVMTIGLVIKHLIMIAIFVFFIA